MTWYKRAKTDERSDTEERKKMEDWFEKRTKRHIGLVGKFCKKIAEYDDRFEELLERAKVHDASKFEDPEVEPYIELTWQKKNNPDYKTTKKINDATLHHVKGNKHHPEYHLEDKSEANISSEDRDKSNKCVDASNMDDISIAEMIADWQAVAEELKENTAREWHNKVKDKRWSWSKKQEELIDKFLKVFE